MIVHLLRFCYAQEQKSVHSIAAVTFSLELLSIAFSSSSLSIWASGEVGERITQLPFASLDSRVAALFFNKYSILPLLQKLWTVDTQLGTFCSAPLSNHRSETKNPTLGKNLQRDSTSESAILQSRVFCRSPQSCFHVSNVWISRKSASENWHVFVDLGQNTQKQFFGSQPLHQHSASLHIQSI